MWAGGPTTPLQMGATDFDSGIRLESEPLALTLSTTCMLRPGPQRRLGHNSELDPTVTIVGCDGDSWPTESSVAKSG